MYTAVYSVHGRVYVPYTRAVNGVYTVYTGRKHGRVQVFTAHVLGRLRPVYTGRKKRTEPYIRVYKASFHRSWIRAAFVGREHG